MAYPYYMNNYPQYYPQQQMQQQQQSGRIYVQGEAGAKAYLIAPNSEVVLWDTESQTIYLKSADASGVPVLRILDYKMREQQTRPIISDSANFATKDDISSIREEIEAIKAKFADEGSKKK